MVTGNGSSGGGGWQTVLLPSAHDEPYLHHILNPNAIRCVSGGGGGGGGDTTTTAAAAATTTTHSPDSGGTSTASTTVAANDDGGGSGGAEPHSNPIINPEGPITSVCDDLMVSPPLSTATSTTTTTSTPTPAPSPILEAPAAAAKASTAGSNGSSGIHGMISANHHTAERRPLWSAGDEGVPDRGFCEWASAED